MIDTLQTRPAVADRPETLSAAGTAAIAAAEAIAAGVAVDVAAEAAECATTAVVAACAAAARAAGKASSTVAAAVSAAAAAAAQTAMQNALDAQVDVDSATATAVASVAFSLAVVEEGDDADAAFGVPSDTATADAVLTSAAASAMAAARVALTISAAASAAAKAALDAAVLVEGQLHRDAANATQEVRRAIAGHAEELAEAALQFSRRHLQAGSVDGAPAVGQDGSPSPRHPEWASMLADPPLASLLLPVPGDDQGTVVCTSPAERGLLRDISLAQRLVAVVRDDEATFAAAFDAVPAGLLLARVTEGQATEVLHVNAALSEMTGYPAVELLADGHRRLSDRGLGVPAPRLPSAGQLSRTRSEDQVQRWVHADGHEIHVRVRTAATSSSGGRVQHLIYQIDDAGA